MAVWLAAAVLLTLHTRAVRDHLDVVSSATETRAASLNHTMPYLPGAIDAQVWVRYAESLLREKHYQLRRTDIDNAPAGREVHWNSAWAWTIATAGWFEHKLTGRPIPDALDRATLWLPPLVLFLLIVLVSGYLSRHFGALAGAAVAIAMLGHEYFEGTFEPSYADHHGLITMGVFGMTLGFMLMGAGWWSDSPDRPVLLPGSEKETRRWAIISAGCGAFGMWISAASVVPAIAIVGIAAVLVALVGGHTWRTTLSMQFDSRAVRLWGRVGGIACFAFYLLEYFPGHLGMRLEVNHPLYAIAWAGAAELMASLMEFVSGDARRPKPLHLAVAAAATIAPLVVVMLAGSKVFVPIDPFLASLHRQFVSEFMPLWTAGREGITANPWTSVVGIENVALVAGAVLLIRKGRRASPVLWYATLSCVLFTIMAWAEFRWLNNLSGPQIALALAVVATIGSALTLRQRWALVAATFGIAFLPSSIIRITTYRAETEQGVVDQSEKMLMLYRDVAAAIRNVEHGAPVTLLTSPNASLTGGFYGDFRTIGTVFWENLEGLRNAARVFSSSSTDSIVAQLTQLGITHIAVFSEANFFEEYFWLQNRETESDEFETTFAYNLQNHRRPMPWLQSMPYDVPEALADLGVNVQIYKVAAEHAPDEGLTASANPGVNAGLYETALADFRSGALPSASARLDSLIRLLERTRAGSNVASAPDSALHRAYVTRSAVAFAQRDWKVAGDAAVKAVGFLPAPDRPRLYAYFAGQFVKAGHAAGAIRMYSAALEESFNPDLACALAFELSTVQDASLRNGRAALDYARRSLATNPSSPTYLNCMATSLAELGRFDEAVRAADMAHSSARAARDESLELLSNQLAAAFRARKPWRE